MVQLEGFNQKAPSLSGVAGSNLATVAAGRAPQNGQANLMQQARSSSPSAGQVMGGVNAQFDQKNRSLLQNLESFSKLAVGIENQSIVEKAKKDAYTAAANDEPFHKQSVYSLYGRTYNNVMSADYAAKANIQITERSNALAIENANNPEGYDRSMSEFINSYSKNAPTPELSSVIAISGAKVRTSNYGRLKISENNAIKNDKIQTFTENIGLIQNQIIEMAAQGQDADVRLATAANVEYVNAMVSEGLISSADGQKVIKDSRFQITYGSDVRELESYIEKGDLTSAGLFVEEKTSVNREDMDVREQGKYRNDLTKMYNNGIKADAATKRGHKEQANQLISEVNTILALGKAPPKTLLDQALDMSKNASLSKQKALTINIEAYQRVQEYDMLSLPQLEVKVAELEAQTELTSVEAVILKQVRTNLGKRKAGAKTDPQILGMIEGRYAPIKPISVSNGPSALLQELPSRVNNMISNKLEYGEYASQIFTDSEASEYSSYLESNMVSVDEKLSMIEAIAEGAAGQHNAAFNQLRKKGAGIFTTAAAMVVEEKEQVGKGILGGQLLQQSYGNLEGVSNLKTDLASKFSNAMRYASPQDQKALLDSSVAYSYFIAKEKGDITELDDVSMKKVIEDITNGISERNDQEFFLPQGVDDSSFDDWIDDNLTATDFSSVGGITPDQALDLVQDSGKIVSVGSGKYMILDSKGRGLKNMDGLPFILEY